MTAVLDRRTFLVMNGGAGLSAILASGRAPAHAQGTTLRILRWIDAVPAGDEVLAQQMADASREFGAKVTLERIDARDIPARVTAAASAGTGPDIVQMLQNEPHVHEKSLVDVSDVVEEILRAQGSLHPVCEMLCRVGGTWRSVPHAITPYLVVYRKSLHDELGVSEFPKVWQEWYEVGRTLKGRGFPIGQTVARTLMDGPAFWYPYLWSWGGKEVGTDGKTVTLDSSAVSESVKFAVAFWRDCCDERGLSWTDTGNGRAYLSGTIASTLSTASIYLTARDDPGKFRTERDTPLHADIRHAPLPGSGGVGRFSYHRALHHGVMSYSKNPALAKDVLRWLHGREAFEPWFVAERGYAIGCTRMWQRHALWSQDQIMLPFRDAARFYRLFGYAGQPSARAAEAVSRHIVVDMYAKAIRGMPADEAVKWAADELRRIYA